MATPSSNTISPTGNALIDGLLQGSSWTNLGAGRVITYSLNINDDGSTPPNPDVVGGTWSAAWIATASAAFTAWSNVANITFQQAPVNNSQYYFQSTADISLTRTGDDLLSGSGGEIVALGIFPDPSYVTLLGIDTATYPNPAGDIAFDNAYEGYQYLSPGGWGFHTFIHEIGHVLGLKHPGDDGFDGDASAAGRPTFDELGIGDLDTPLWTVMNQNPAAPAATGFAATPMPLDILAIQHIYGANMTHHAGDDVYVLADDGIVKTIWDAGGMDTMDASALGFGVDLNLHEGTFNQHGTSSTTAIAYNVVIENAIGSAFSDRITGNDADNYLAGGAGADLMGGGSGNDTLDGGSGDDGLFGSDGNDILRGGPGSDTMKGGAGNDTYFVDDATDVVAEAVNAGTDTVQTSVTYKLPGAIENLVLTGSSDIDGTGSGIANHITGNSGNNVLKGGNGNDTIIGGDGDDTLIGGKGNDVLHGGIGADSMLGGSGSDRFTYSAIVDLGDTIRAFSPGPGGDLMDLQGLIDNVLGGSYMGNPVADGHLGWAQTGRHTQVFFDSDGPGGDSAVTLATLLHVSATDLTLADNFLV